MPKGRVLTPAERETIVEMHRAGASGREIAKKLERSKTVVLNFLRDPAQYAQTKRSGRKRALSSEDERRLYVALFRRPPPAAVARNGEASAQVQQQQEEEDGEARLSEALGMDLGAAAAHLGAAAALSASKSAEQIKREFNLPLSVRRIQQLLSEWRTHARRQLDVTAQAASLEQQESKEEGAGDVAATVAGVATSDDISSADAMLALPDERADKPTHTGLEALGIDVPPSFPELQLALAVDKLPPVAEIQAADVSVIGEPANANTKEGMRGSSDEPAPAEATVEELPSLQPPITM